jgi:putative ABC transport system permease protein
MQDIRLAVRRLLRKKIFTIVIILCLALGVGANSAIFSVINSLMLRQLDPIQDVDRVVFTFDMREHFDPFGVALMDAAAFKKESYSFTSIGVGRAQVFRLLGRDRPERIAGAAITSDYLPTLGVQPGMGRTFRPEDDRPEAPPVVLLSHSLWKGMFGGDAEILGRTLNLDYRVHTVIGVLPQGFDLPNRTSLWVPLATEIEALPLEQQATHNNFVIARLKPGVSLDQANTEAGIIARRLEQEYPQFRKNWGIKLVPLRQQLIGDPDGNLRRTLLVLMAIVGFLLLIACANVASLFLARSVERSHEIAIQTALGAGARRLIGQLLTESVILSLLGGAVGLLFARFVTASLMKLKPVYLVALGDVFENVEIDARVLGFTFVISLFTAAVFALAPAARTVLKGNLIDHLKEGGQRTGSGIGGRRLFDALMVGEIAVATVLLIGAGLMIRSFQRLSEAKLGFRPEQLVAMEMALSEVDYPRYEQKVDFVKRLLDKVRTLPGVVSAGTSTNIPLSAPSWDAIYTVEGRPPLDGTEVPITAHRLVSDDYLETMGVSLLNGRLVANHDQTGALPVVVISKEFAEQAWPGEDPIGKRVKRGNPPAPNAVSYTVVGVVDDVKEDGTNFRIDRPVWYIPYAQMENTLPVTLLVRTEGAPSSVVASVRETIRSINNNQPVSETIVVENHVNEFLGPQRFTALLSSLFAGLGLILAAVGVYGITYYSVTKRTREFSVRMAFGAKRRDLTRLVLGRGLRLALLGMMVGSMGGVALTGVLSSLLYQVSPGAPETFAVPVGVLLAVVIVAIFLPLRRIINLDPMTGLRQE